MSFGGGGQIHSGTLRGEKVALKKVHHYILTARPDDLARELVGNVLVTDCLPPGIAVPLLGHTRVQYLAPGSRTLQDAPALVMPLVGSSMRAVVDRYREQVLQQVGAGAGGDLPSWLALAVMAFAAVPAGRLPAGSQLELGLVHSSLNQCLTQPPRLVSLFSLPQGAITAGAEAKQLVFMQRLSLLIKSLADSSLVHRDLKLENLLLPGNNQEHSSPAEQHQAAQLGLARGQQPRQASGPQPWQFTGSIQQMRQQQEQQQWQLEQLVCEHAELRQEHCCMLADFGLLRRFVPGRPNLTTPKGSVEGCAGLATHSDGFSAWGAWPRCSWL
jgi:hypothetical protein